MPKYPDFMESTRYGHPDGLKGINCRHDFFGVDTDIQSPSYTDDELAALADREKKKRPYKTTDRKGNKITREYTPYEATQRMRGMETAMRNQRALAKGYEAGGNTDLFYEARAKYHKQLKEYLDFAKEMEMKPDLQARVYVDGLGRI